MPFNVKMTDKQKVAIGVTILDNDTPPQPYTELPDGVAVTFVSDHPEIADVTVRPDGMNADIGSGKVGTAVITVSVTGITPPIPTDTVTIQVVNSAPGSLNLTVGEPTDE